VPIKAVPIKAVPIKAVPIKAVPIKAVPIKAVPIKAVPINGVDRIIAYRDYEQKTFVEWLLQKYHSLSRSYKFRR